MVKHRLVSGRSDLKYGSETHRIIPITATRRRSIKVACCVPRQRTGGPVAIRWSASEGVQGQEIPAGIYHEHRAVASAGLGVAARPSHAVQISRTVTDHRIVRISPLRPADEGMNQAVVGIRRWGRRRWG